MRVAALYDIHGNLPALEAVLDEVRAAGADEIVVGGDVYPGPMANEALACLLDLDLAVSFLHGNGDREIVALANGEKTSDVPEQHVATMRWQAQRLPAGYRDLMAQWPASIRLHVDGPGDVLFCHATPRNDTDIFTRLTTDDVLAPIFERVPAKTVVCGHTHMQFDRTIGDIRVLNAGSVGMPFGEAGAFWLLLGPDVQMRRTEYDLARAAERIRATDYPTANDFAARFVLERPSGTAMLGAYSRVSIK